MNPVEIKIAYIGGGSRYWARDLISELALTPRLKGWIDLYDLDHAAAERNVAVAARIYRRPEAVTRFTVRAVRRLADALRGADFVVLSIEPGPTAMRFADLVIPERHGILQPVGDTTGPGGIARALRAGQSLAFGFNAVSLEMADPISKEFHRVFEEQNLGVPLEDSLSALCDRVPNLDLKFFVTAVTLQRQTGGDLAEILDKISHIIRERFKILGQVQALTGEGRISGIVLQALPIVLFFVVYHLNPDYVMLLFTDPLGRKMIAVAAFLQVMGAICIKKIVNIKV